MRRRLRRSSTLATDAARTRFAVTRRWRSRASRSGAPPFVDRLARGRARTDVRARAIDLLHEGFDSLEEDFAEEQFFAVARAAYWKAPDGSPDRTVAATLIDKLEF